MRLHIFLLASGLLILSNSSVFAEPITGKWLTHRARSMINITRCGAGLCGQIIWLRNKLNSLGQPMRDERNSNKHLRSRRVLGLTTFSGLTLSGPGRWSGLMYNPNDGGTYNASLTFTSAGSLQVEGCLMGSNLCGRRNWTRAK